MRQLDDDIKKAMARWHEVTPRLFADLAKTAGYQPPQQLCQRFDSLHKRLFDETTPCLDHLRHPRLGGVDWLKRFRSGLLDNVQEGAYACCYHLSRIEVVESTMVQIAESYLSALGPTPTSSAVGGGNSRALNYEYQALAFSLRRTLEYLGVAIAAFFKCDCHSVRHLAKIVGPREPADEASRVVRCLSQHLANLEDVLPPDKQVRRSLRDRLAHWEAVKAGCFNVVSSPTGFMIGLVGGGHDLDFGHDHPGRSVSAVHVSALGPTLRDQFERTMSLIWALVAAAGLDEAA